MPAAIPAVIGLAAGYAATAGLTGLVIGAITIGATAASIIGGIIGLGISYGLGQLLNPKPKSTTADAQDRQQLVRSELLPVSRTPSLGVLMRTESANGTTII